MDDAAGQGLPPGLPRGPTRGRGDRPRIAAGADLLAGRRGAADHLGAGHHPRPAGRAGRPPAPEPGHLSPAGHRPTPGDHALAGAPRRRARLSRVRGGAAGPAVSARRRPRRRSGDHARRRHAGARFALRIPVRRPAARQPDRGQRLLGRRRRRHAAGAGERRVRLRGPHPGRAGRFRRNERARRRDQGDRRLPARARRPVRRPHRLLQRAGLVPGVRDRAHDAPARPDLPLDLHRQASRRAGRSRRRAQRSVRADPAEAVSRDRRLLPAARGLQLPDGDRQHQEALPGPRQARHVRRLELPAPVHVHQVHRRHRRRRRRAQLERSDLGDHHAHGPGARHRARRPDADRLPRLRLAGVGAGRQDGPRRDDQAARRDRARMGPADPPRPGGRGARRGAGRGNHGDSSV